MDAAKRMVAEASLSDAEYVKFQVYKAELIASKYAVAYWDRTFEQASSQHQLFKKYDHFNKSDYEDLQRYATCSGVGFTVTPFDLQCIDWLDALVPFFKIASADITFKPMLEKLAAKKKPLVLSTGAASMTEIEAALNILQTSGEEICVLHCVLNYPCHQSDSVLARIEDLRKNFLTEKVSIGLSDHVRANGPGMFDHLLAAQSLGIAVVEKHFTFDKSLPGNDHYHSMDADDLKGYVTRRDALYQAFGFEIMHEWPSSQSASRLQARRSLFWCRDLKQGSIIQSEDFICLRPGQFISPMRIGDFVGKKLLRSVSLGEPVDESCVNESELDNREIF